MNTSVINMILRLKEWEEELEKQKFANMLSEKLKTESIIKNINDNFESIAEKLSNKNEKFLSENLSTLFSDIEYLTKKFVKTKEVLKEIEHELEKQRELYEEAYKEKRKIEQLYERLITSIRKYRESLEEKMISDILISRYGR
jgi:flagellar export protein FliJ